MNDGYYRFATVAGDRLAFVCDDDLWTADLDGGAATRLTATPGVCTTPRFSPDGSLLAFIATDEGHPEVYVMPSGGGRPRRLTYLGGTMATLCAWSEDGSQIYFTANPNVWYERELRAFAVSPDGGLPRELRLGHMRTLSPGPNGRFAIGRNETDPARWKRYRGGTSGEIWCDVEGDGRYTKLPLPNGNPVWPMWIGERIFFLADHEGIANVYSCTPQGADVRRHTHQDEYYARFPSTDGKRIVFTAGGKLLCYEIATGETRQVPVTAASAAPQTARRFLNGSEALDEFAPSPDGTGLALIARGQPYTMPFWEEAPIRHGGGSASRSRCIEWMNDAKRFVCVTDMNGFEQIALHEADGSKEPVLLTESDIGRVTGIACSPKKDWIAIANHRYELLLLDARDRSLRTLDRSLGNRITDLAFSPDGRFLAYVWWPGGENAAIVRIARCKSGEVHDVTPKMRVDQSPAWDPQGRYLYFISTRDFDPVYDALQFGLSFPQAQRPFAVTLREDVPNPFAPKPKPVHKEHDRDPDPEDRKKDRAPVRIEIGFEGIEGRILAFPVDEGEYGQIVAVKDRVFFTQFEVRGIKPQDHAWDEDEDLSGTLLAYDFEQQRSAAVAQEVGEIEIAADAHTLVYRSHDRLRVIDALADLPEEHDEQKPPNEPGRKSGWVDLDRISIEVEPRDEWAQMYREAWRLQNEHFWVEDMSDVDWRRVYERYAALLPGIRTRAELSDLIWEMHGELGTSHAYEIGGDVRVPPQYKRGFLGADFTYDKEAQTWRIERIYRGDSWNRDVDSPLAEPGLGIRAGDAILAIGGKRLSRDLTPNQALVNEAGRELSILVRASDGSSRAIAVRTLKSEQALRYRAWVDAARKRVHDATDGRIGYLHIPDMGPWGFSEFHRGYLSEYDRGGLIVDVRYNRGGHVSPLLLEKLARKRVGYDVSRYSHKPFPYPPESLGGPMVGITNQFAGSDGDIFSHCFKMYKLGPLIGKRTWGGVIGINPYHRLVDGTITTQPEFSFWFKDVGWRVENYGTDPDFDVDIAPHDYRDGKDPQMDLAIRLALDAIERHEERYPDLATKPSLTLPSLTGAPVSGPPSSRKQE